jgi:hypothetical protein
LAEEKQPPAVMSMYDSLSELPPSILRAIERLRESFVEIMATLVSTARTHRGVVPKVFGKHTPKPVLRWLGVAVLSAVGESCTCRKNSLFPCRNASAESKTCEKKWELSVIEEKSVPDQIWKYVNEAEETMVKKAPRDECALVMFNMEGAENLLTQCITLHDLTRFMKLSGLKKEQPGFGAVDLSLLVPAWNALTQDQRRAFCYVIFRVPERLWPAQAAPASQIRQQSWFNSIHSYQSSVKVCMVCR